MAEPDISIVFRALNEEKYFEQALEGCIKQQLDGDLTYEIILVDSGSTDRTLEIAEKFKCRIVHITRQQFSFGRSLNWGCDAALGKYLIFISAHCIPNSDRWLQELVQPLIDDKADYTYGKQIGAETSKFSENQLFAKYYPKDSAIPQKGFFVNNANSAIKTSVWRRYRFDEEVTGLEDMVLGKTIVQEGGKIGYVSSAPVVHIHEESVSQVKKRYYREALTLREVMPNVHMQIRDFVRFLLVGIMHDLKEAVRQKVFFSKAKEIVLFRSMQFWGSYRGHNEHHALSSQEKEAYYYPALKKIKESNKAGQKRSITFNRIDL